MDEGLLLSRFYCKSSAESVRASVRFPSCHHRTDHPDHSFRRRRISAPDFGTLPDLSGVAPGGGTSNISSIHASTFPGSRTRKIQAPPAMMQDVSKL